MQVNVVHIIHGERPWQNWYKNLLLLHAEELTSLHPYCVFPMLIFAKAAILTSTLRIKWRTEKGICETFFFFFFLCEAIKSSLSLRKGQSEELLAVICMPHKVHQSHLTLKALASLQSTFLTASKFPSMSSQSLVCVVCSVYMTRWSRDKLLGPPVGMSCWMHNPISWETEWRNTSYGPLSEHWNNGFKILLNGKSHSFSGFQGPWPFSSFFLA